jgi:histidine phosphotransferase ChpT
MKFNLTAADLAALLCSKVCHDVISPVGAINNGLELLEEGGADEDAMNLIKQSAHTASARLQFARIAFGAAGSAGVQIDTGDAQLVATQYMKGEKAQLSWEGPRVLMPKNQVKLLLNLILVGIASIPRGGNLNVKIENPETNLKITVTTGGKMLRVPPKFLEMHSENEFSETVDAHSIQAYYTLLLASESKMQINIMVNSDDISFIATPYLS